MLSSSRTLDGLTEKCGPQTTKHNVDADSEWYQKDRRVDIHASKRSDNRTASQKKLAAHKHVGKQSKEYIDPMGHDTIAGVDDFQVSVASRCILLDFAS